MGDRSREALSDFPPVDPPASFLRRAYRRLYWLPRDLAVLYRAGLPDWVIYFGGTGFGDDLLLTSVLHELRKRNSGRLAVISRLTEIFENAPFVDWVAGEDWSLLGAANRWGRKNGRPHYYRGLREPDIDIAADGHIIAEMCRQIGLRGHVELKPHIFLRPEEIAKGRRTERQAVIQCMSAASVNASPNKVWVAERYQQVVDQNRGRCNFIQIGSKQDPLLEGVIDLRGQTSIRESAAILAQAQFFVGYVGFLMHLARAVDCRAAIIFGGREHPSQSGYVCNENLYTPLPCAPCWRRKTCVAEHACMTAIEASHVSDAITRLLAAAGTPLELAYEDIA